MRRMLVALLFGLMMLPTYPVAAAGTNITLRLAAFRPVKTTTGFRWVQFKCDGSAVLSGVASVRLLGFATNHLPVVAEGPRLRITYGPGERWYQYVFPRLAPGVETQVFDTVQDFGPPDEGDTPQFNFSVVGAGGVGTQVCPYTVTNLPAQSEALKSRRTQAGPLLTDLRIEVRRYSDGTLLPCGSVAPVNAGRVKVDLFAHATVPGTYDLHAHVERMPAATLGPDQDGDGVDARWWEIGFFKQPVPPANMIQGAGDHVGTFTTNWAVPGGQPGAATVHFGQQTGPNQPHNEVFCKVTFA